MQHRHRSRLRSLAIGVVGILAFAGLVAAPSAHAQDAPVYSEFEVDLPNGQPRPYSAIVLQPLGGGGDPLYLWPHAEGVASLVDFPDAFPSAEEVHVGIERGGEIAGSGILWWNGSSFADGAPVGVMVSGDGPDRLVGTANPGGGTIAGAVHPSGADAFITVVRTADQSISAWLGNDVVTGAYAAFGLEPGTYRVQFTARGPSESAPGGYLTTWHEDAEEFADADDVVVADGETTIVDITLEAAALVTGSLYNVSSTGVETLVTEPEAAVSFYPPGSHPAAADAEQVYAFGGSYWKPLPAGTYNVAFGTLATGFGNAGFSTKQYYDRAASESAATSITLAAAEERDEVDAYYEQAVRRLAGSNRYATSAAISADTFAPDVPVAYIANGLNFPDALSASAIAGPNGGPILLTAPSSLPGVIADELIRLQPGRIVVLGSEASVSSGVFAALHAYTDGAVERLAGKDRFATSAAISRSQFAGASSVPVAYVTSGFTFPDALAASAIAGPNGGPILLSRGDVLPEAISAELEALEPERIVVLGSSASISAAVFDALDTYTDGPVTRLAGPNRYATAAAISESEFDPGVPVVYVTNGQTFPDALSASAIAGINGGPILLTATGSIPGPTAAELERLDPQSIVVLGSSASVSDSVFAQLHDFVG